MLAKSKASICAEKFLKLRLRHVFRHWRKETDMYLSEVKFLLRCKILDMQKRKMAKLIKIRILNEKVMMRHVFRAF